MKLIGSIGRGLYERVDPLFVAETPAQASYLGHMRWMAAGFGLAAERVVDRTITDTGSICRIRDVPMLVSGKAEPALDAWVAKAGARRALPQDTVLAPRRDGSAAITIDGRTVEAAAVVLADDAAILSLLPPGDRPRLFEIVPTTSLVTDPAPKPLAAAFVHYLDRGVTLHQRGGKGAVTAIATGDTDSADARIGASLSGQGALRRMGRASFRRIAVADGAPLLGRVGKSRWIVAAGFGDNAAFLAPAVARHLAGAASDDEGRYFAARDPARAAQRAAVAEAATAPASIAEPSA